MKAEDPSATPYLRIEIVSTTEKDLSKFDLLQIIQEQIGNPSDLKVFIENKIIPNPVLYMKSPSRKAFDRFFKQDFALLEQFIALVFQENLNLQDFFPDCIELDSEILNSKGENQEPKTDTRITNGENRIRNLENRIINPATQISAQEDQEWRPDPQTDLWEFDFNDAGYTPNYLTLKYTTNYKAPLRENLQYFQWLSDQIHEYVHFEEISDGFLRFYQRKIDFLSNNLNRNSLPGVQKWLQLKQARIPTAILNKMLEILEVPEKE